MKSSFALAQELLTPAGLVLNGPHSYDPQIKDERTIDRVLRSGIIGVGESYMDGWWDARDIPELVARMMRSSQIQKLFSMQLFSLGLAYVRAQLTNMQSRARAFQVAEQHYDIGNDLYERMLDARLTYSCGYWKDVHTLDDAQTAKLDLVCRKIGLKKGDRVLDIGCGWGSFAIYAAETYGAEVVGVTVSVEQAAFAQARAAGLPVDIRVQDYRDIDDGPFDHVISIGMFEHVGPKNYRTYMELVKNVLKDDGLFLLHTIGFKRTPTVPDPWIDKYIFPNGITPGAAQITAAADGLFTLEDWHNFGADYEHTLLAWFANFDRTWPEISEKYGERFYRMWKFYLLSCAGAFRARDMQLFQIVFSPHGVPGGYIAVR